MLELCDNDAKFQYRYLGICNKAIISLFVATGLRLEELSEIRLSGMDAIISLFVATGLRLEELSEIRLSGMDPRLQQVRVVGKGAKARVVPISREAREALKRYLQVRLPGGSELWKTDDGQPMAMDSITIMIVRLKKRAGVNGDGRAHRFRHYFATKYLEAGGDLNSLRLLLEHATLDMVLKYTKYIDVRKALAEHE